MTIPTKASGDRFKADEVNDLQAQLTGLKNSSLGEISATSITAKDVDGTTASVLTATRFQHLVDHTSGHVNVKSYGADPTGTADSTAAVQTALDAAYAAGGGTVLAPRGVYKITGSTSDGAGGYYSLRTYQNVRLVGVGRDHAQQQKGTHFLHQPTQANTDFLVVQRDPSGPVPGTYVDTELEGFQVWGSYPNSRDGIVIKMGRAVCKNVEVLVFGGKAWRLSGMIVSSFTDCQGQASDYGFYFEPTGLLSTTTTFRNCRAGSGNRIGLYVGNAVGIVWDGSAVEGVTEHAIVVDGGPDGGDLTLINPYFENIARNHIRAGANGTTVRNITVLGGYYQSGVQDKLSLGGDPTWDMIYLDRVAQANIKPGYVNLSYRASLLRTTTNTSAVEWGGWQVGQAEPAQVNRANGATYTKGQIVRVVCTDGITRPFMVVQGGIVAGAPPAYARTGVSVADGSALLTAYGAADEYNGGAFFDQSKVLVSTPPVAPSMTVAGAIGFSPSADAKPRRVSYTVGAPSASYPNSITPQQGDQAINTTATNGEPLVWSYQAGEGWRPLSLHYSGYAAPTTGTWKIGDVVENLAITRNAPTGWICRAAGAPGTWERLSWPFQPLSSPAYPGNVIDASLAPMHYVIPTDGNAITIPAPTNGVQGQTITVNLRNTFGVLGATTFTLGAGGYRLGAAWTNPANGFSRSITFNYDGSKWIETGRTDADVSN